MRPIYLDYNATTPVDERVVEAMLPFLTDHIGNAASVDHFYGHEAQQAVEEAREKVATLVGADSQEIVFTSGATEADNLAVLGSAARADEDAEILVSEIEHPAVLESARQLGSRVKSIPVSADGLVDPDEVRRLLTAKTALVSVMAANNETGAVQPVAAVSAICAEADVAFHSDAAQATRHVELNVKDAGISLLSLSGHKVYGPKGVGALYLRKRGRRAKVAPLLFGGGQERGLHPGTTNVPGIVGFGVAAELARKEREIDAAREGRLRDMLVASLGRAGEVTLNSPADHTLPQTVSARIAGIGARALMHATREDLAFSSGSACATAKVEPSHVLLAQGLSPRAAGECVRISFGRFTTDEEIARTGEVMSNAIERLHQLAAVA